MRANDPDVVVDAGVAGASIAAVLLFVAAALGRIQAAQVVAAMHGHAWRASSAVAGGLHGFPAALTSFVGRAGAVSEVVGLLAPQLAGDGDRAGRLREDQAGR